MAPVDLSLMGAERYKAVLAMCPPNYGDYDHRSVKIAAKFKITDVPLDSCLSALTQLG